MTREFQVLYQLRPDQEIRSMLAIADGQDQIQSRFDAAGIRVISITQIRPVVDWTKPNFDRDEAGAFFCMAGSTLSVYKANGSIPCSKPVGNCVYPRVWLERLIKDHANTAGKDILKILKHDL